MKRIDWHTRIEISPDIHHGDACIRGTRIPVSMILGSLADGLTANEIIQEYPQLKQDDIQAALSYASEAVRSDVLVPLTLR